MLLVSTSYFPPVDYYRELIQHDSVVLDLFEFYEKQTWRNRCAILGPNGVQILVVPVKRIHGIKMRVKDTCIAYDEDWQSNHLRSLMTAYKNSPFYDYIIDDFIPIFEKKEKFLLDLNLKIHDVICGYLHIPGELTHSDQYVDLETNILSADDGHRDLRFYKQKNKEYHKIINKEDNLPYHQVFCDKFDFVAGLSVLDLLFNTGNDAYDILNTIKTGSPA